MHLSEKKKKGKYNLIHILYSSVNLRGLNRLWQRVIARSLANTVTFDLSPWTGPTVPRLPCLNFSGSIKAQRILLPKDILALSGVNSAGWLWQRCLSRLALHGDTASHSLKSEFHLQVCRGRKLHTWTWSAFSVIQIVRNKCVSLFYLV